MYQGVSDTARFDTGSEVLRGSVYTVFEEENLSVE